MYEFYGVSCLLPSLNTRFRLAGLPSCNADDADHADFRGFILIDKDPDWNADYHDSYDKR
jgi:hypothetical protein